MTVKLIKLGQRLHMRTLPTPVHPHSSWATEDTLKLRPQSEQRRTDLMWEKKNPVSVNLQSADIKFLTPHSWAQPKYAVIFLYKFQPCWFWKVFMSLDKRNAVYKPEENTGLLHPKTEVFSDLCLKSSFPTRKLFLFLLGLNQSNAQPPSYL